MLFRYLDNKSVQLHHNLQTYITTTSNLLAYLFTASIKIALAVAFAQHLWHIMRRSEMKVSTIEMLFSIRSNPLRLFRINSIKKTWILFSLAVLLYIIPIATSFPPGALTVRSTSPVEIVPSKVPTYNGSFVSSNFSQAIFVVTSRGFVSFCHGGGFDVGSGAERTRKRTQMDSLES